MVGSRGDSPIQCRGKAWRFPLASDWPAADTSEGSRLRASAAEWDMLDTRAGFDAAGPFLRREDCGQSNGGQLADTGPFTRRPCPDARVIEKRNSLRESVVRVARLVCSAPRSLPRRRGVPRRTSALQWTYPINQSVCSHWRRGDAGQLEEHLHGLGQEEAHAQPRGEARLPLPRIALRPARGAATLQPADRVEVAVLLGVGLGLGLGLGLVRVS